MKKLLALILAALLAQTAQAGIFGGKCSESGCLVVNGKNLSFDEAESLLYTCDSFRQSRMGRMAVSLDYGEIAKRTNNNPNTPLMDTYMHYIAISESPLAFSRKAKDANLKYHEIVQACVQLKRDFNGDRYWIK